MDEEIPKVASKVSPIWTGVMSQSCASVRNGKKPAVLSHIPYRHFGPLETQKWAAMSQKPNFEHPVFFFFVSSRLYRRC